MSLSIGTIIVVFAATSFEAPICRINEETNTFQVELNLGGKMSFHLPDNKGGCDGYGHNVYAKVKGA
ncbi:MAG: hypothetical protein COA47_10080 [Robiginitomaculum sp.]|nr:MAG: hypothetical protein COA47_10080 [Robiginitomaculum sp.]